MSSAVPTGARSIPLEHALAPRVDVRQQQDDYEEDDLKKQQVARDPILGMRHRPPEDRRPGVEEDDLDVEHEEDHRDDVEADVEPLAGVADRHHAALVRGLLARARATRADD